MTRHAVLPLVLGSAAAAALLGAAASAQGSQVIPPQWTNVEGNSLSQEPFGFDRVKLVQYVHRNLLGSLTPGRVLRGVRYRRDGAIARTTTLRRMSGTTKYKPLWTVIVGDYSGNVGAPSPVYPTARTAGWTTVINGKQMDFPDLPPPTSSGPAPWTINLPFDTPKTFRGPHLGVLHSTYNRTIRPGVYAYYVDALQNLGNLGTVKRISPTAIGCPRGANRATGITRNPGGGNLEFYLFDAPPNAPVWAAYGTNTSQWGPNRLPLDMTPFGLPGCFAYTDWTVVVPARADATGLAQQRTPIPAIQALRGQTLYGQWIVRDSRVSPTFGFAMSDGLAFTLGRGFGTGQIPMAVVSGVQNIAQRNIGFVQPGWGSIFRVDW